MMSKQPKTTDSYRKGWEKAFKSKQGDSGSKTRITVNDFINHAIKRAETTEQKQPNE